MILPKVIRVLHLFLHYRVGDDFQFTPYGLSARLGLSVELAGAHLMYSLFGIVPKVFKVAGNEAQ